MSTVSLESLRADIDQKFAPLRLELSDGTEVVLQHLLRLPTGVRKEVIESLRSIRKKPAEEAPEGQVNPEAKTEDDSADADQILAATQRVIELVAKDRKGKKLVAQIGDDLALTSKIIEMWTAATQPGEAQPSHD